MSEAGKQIDAPVAIVKGSDQVQHRFPLLTRYLLPGGNKLPDMRGDFSFIFSSQVKISTRTPLNEKDPRFSCVFLAQGEERKRTGLEMKMVRKRGTRAGPIVKDGKRRPQIPGHLEQKLLPAENGLGFMAAGGDGEVIGKDGPGIAQKEKGFPIGHGFLLWWQVLWAKGTKVLFFRYFHVLLSRGIELHHKMRTRNLELSRLDFPEIPAGTVECRPGEALTAVKCTEIT